MSKFITALTSPVGRKFLTGITGIGLLIFVITHLIGNLQLFIGPEVFNSYSHKLESLGIILYILEAGLLITFILHAITGINIYIRKKKARPVDYKVYTTAGGVSKQTFSSRSMMVTGSIILLFTIFHVLSFKFGSGIKEGYVTMAHGIEVRDLHRLVIETFQDLKYVIGYVGIMILLGLHLRHGAWSAFQSLGVMNKKYTSAIYITGVIFALLISLGFIVLPVWIYLKGI